MSHHDHPFPLPLPSPLLHFAVREFVAWWPKYPFLSGADLEAWGRITWWEGPDRSGRLWLMIDNRAAVSASRAHGADVVARVVISNVSGGGGASGLPPITDGRARGVCSGCGRVLDGGAGGWRPDPRMQHTPHSSPLLPPSPPLSSYQSSHMTHATTHTVA